MALPRGTQAAVETKFGELLAAGWQPPATVAQEQEFKSLLFRKLLDGRLGARWAAADEAAFKALLVFKKGPAVPPRRILE